MDKHHVPAIALALCAGAACAQWVGPFEGGQAADAYRVPKSAATMLDRATVAAQGREAARQVDSRAGYQSDAERVYGAAPLRTSTLTRAEVRSEAITAMRESATQRTFDGGQAATQ